MAQRTETTSIHPDLHVVHSIPGRIRLRAHQMRGHSQHAQEIARRLSAVPGVLGAVANASTGSITVRYHPSLLDQAESLAEIAATLGLIATGIDPGEVEALFQVLGVSPKDIRDTFGGASGRNLAAPLALFVAGFLVGRRFG